MFTLAIASLVCLTNAFGRVEIDTVGARVASYVPAGGDETFVTLESGVGGVPLCWPWFQFNGPSADSPKHGIVRDRDFAVVSRTADRAVLRLVSDERTRRLFPHDFELELAVTLGEGLTLALTGRNTGSTEFSVTEAFHPYIARARLAGLENTGTGDFRTWDPDATSWTKTTGLAPDEWKRFVCVENGTFAKDRSYRLKPGESHTLVRRFQMKDSQTKGKK